jgi:hypothetical protein
VGGNGVSDGQPLIGGDGGYNGGGNGGNTFFNGQSAGGGGGASDIRLLTACPASTPGCPTPASSLASRLIVAGGGGGGGGAFAISDTAAGGFGGAADAAGGTGLDDTHGDTHGGGGARGQTTVGGAAGSDPGASTSRVTAGTLGAGGTGGTDGGGGGGGGGGGVYGGGGGGGGIAQVPSTNPPIIYGAGGGGRGGGASSLPPGPAGVTNLSLIPTDTGARPLITLTWTLPAPTATTTAASAVTFSSAILHGTVNPNATPLSGCQFTISPKPPGGSTLSCAQQIGSGTTPVAVSAQLLGLSSSTTYTVRLSASDAQGQSTGTPTTFRTLPPLPRISGFGAKVVRRHGRRQGSIILQVSQAVTLMVTFEQKQGKRWVALKRTVSAKVRAGSVKLGFSPRGLKPGRYRLTVVATNAVNERSRPQQTTFTITR